MKNHAIAALRACRSITGEVKVRTMKLPLDHSSSLSRRKLLAAGAASLALPALARATDSGVVSAAAAGAARIVSPPQGKGILLSVKLGMIANKLNGKPLTLAQRLSLAGEAGLDGVDFDQAGGHTAEAARAAVQESGVFVHNAINHAHWGKRLTSANKADRDTAHANIEHCIRLSHAAGGNGGALSAGDQEINSARCLPWPADPL